MAVAVLIVEDDPSIGQLMHDALGLDGYRVITVGRPDEVQQAAALLAPDIFLIDVMLPGVSGIELASQLREEGYASVPMIAMTTSPFLSEVARESGLFQVVMEKPLDLDTLIVQIDNLLPVVDET